MKHIIERYYCDGCGVGGNDMTNEPYLGWVHINVYPDGIPLAKPLTADLCGLCSARVWKSIPLP